MPAKVEAQRAEMGSGGGARVRGEVPVPGGCAGGVPVRGDVRGLVEGRPGTAACAHSASGQLP